MFWPFSRPAPVEAKALTDDQLHEMLGVGIPTSSGVAVSSQQALRVPAVASAVRTISEAAASLDLRVMAVADDGAETDLSRATWSNSAEMQRQFLLLCLEPWLKAVEGALRRALFLPDERRRFAVRFDRDDFSNVDLAVRATAINSLVASRVINPNTGREWLGGLSPYEGGEAYANPNTGASQPGTPAAEPPANLPKVENEDTDGSE